MLTYVKGLFVFCQLLGSLYASEIDIKKELFITDLSVVNSLHARTGALSFKHLMNSIVGKNLDPADLTENWLMGWTKDEVINNHKISGKKDLIEKFLKHWPRTSAGKLDLDKSPLVLTAIVNRVDLFDSILGNKNGQLRFVFNALDAKGEDMPFMWIFEFELPFKDQQFWVNKWHVLGKIDFGENYNRELISITEEILKNQTPELLRKFRLRTGEITFSFPTPETRSFCLDWQINSIVVCEGLLTPDLVFNTPEINGGRSSELIEWIKLNVDDILNDQYVLPKKFRTGNYPVSAFKWAAELENNDDELIKKARKKFSMNTCNGCHNPVENVSVVMVEHRKVNEESRASKFLVEELEKRKLLMMRYLPTN